MARPRWVITSASIVKRIRIFRSTFVYSSQLSDMRSRLDVNDCHWAAPALEPKARLGARPDPMRIWIRHRIPMLNLIVRGLLHTIDDHEEPPQRNPFK